MLAADAMPVLANVPAKIIDITIIFFMVSFPFRSVYLSLEVRER